MNLKKTKFIFLIVLFSLVACGQEESEVSTQKQTAVIIPAGNAENGKQLSSECISCHGSDGASSKNAAPFIAGQKNDYFKAAMHAYASGARSHEEMNNLAAKFDESGISDLAAYYSSINTEWDPAPYRPKAIVKPGITKSDISAGEKLSGACIGCHGESGNSKQPGIPSLAGMQPEYIVSALTAYFADTRQDPIMKNFKHAIDKNEMRKLAAYFNSQTRVALKPESSGNKKKGQSIADTHCVGCHGASGNSTVATMPSLSGQNAEYLNKALNAYKKGSRKNKMMQDVLKSIASKDFKDIAAYYESQTPQRFDPQQTDDNGGFDPIAKGEKLALTCNGCHGKNGNSTTAGIPSLTRLHPEYLKSAIAAYATGTRSHELMKSFVKPLGEDDKERISLYYATQEPAQSNQKIKGDSSAAEELSATCNGCHGEKGNSSQALTPSLAGQDPSYIVTALKAYQSGQRTQQDMQNAVKDLKPSDISNIAALYAKQEPLKLDIHIPDPPEVISAKCDRCHGVNGFSAVLDIPRIGGQIESYLFDTLMSYKNKTRDHAVMFAMADGLSVLEMKAIAKYYSEQKQP